MGQRASRAVVAGAGLAAVAGTGGAVTDPAEFLAHEQLAIAPPPERLMIAPPADWNVDKGPYPGEMAPRPGAVVPFDSARAGTAMEDPPFDRYYESRYPETAPSLYESAGMHFGYGQERRPRDLTPQPLAPLEDPEAERRRRALDQADAMTARQRKRAGRAERGLSTRGSGGGMVSGGGGGGSGGLLIGILLLVAVAVGLYYGIKDIGDASKTNKTAPWIMTIASGLVGLGVLGYVIRDYVPRRPRVRRTPIDPETWTDYQQ